MYSYDGHGGRHLSLSPKKPFWVRSYIGIRPFIQLRENALKNVVFPKGSKRIFRPTILFGYPYFAQYFGDDDFYGLVLDCFFVPDREGVDKTNDSLTRLSGLRAVWLNKDKMTADSIAHLDSLPDLTWFFSRGQYCSGKNRQPQSFAPVQGAGG